MDGENNGKSYEQMDDLGGYSTPIFGNIFLVFIGYIPFKGLLGELKT